MTAYLDNAATTRVCDEAAQAALKIMTENYGNPSSTHKMGRDARDVLDSSRAAIAGALGARPEEIFFTSCGSESDNWAILSGAEKNRRLGKHIISSMKSADKALEKFYRSEIIVVYMDQTNGIRDIVGQGLVLLQKYDAAALMIFLLIFVFIA